MNRLVSIKIPVLNAIQDMGLDIVKDVPTFTRWAVDAEREIGSYYSLRKIIEVIKVENCCAELPCDTAFVQYVLLGDHGCDCGDLIERCTSTAIDLTAATNSSFVIDDEFNDAGDVVTIGPKWEVQGGKIVFRRDYDGQYITVQYLGFEKDEDGFPLIGENHVEAVVTYIQYKYAVRSRFSPVKMDHTDKMFFWREWMRLASHARADDSELSDSDRLEIVAMIHDPWSGIGLESGMYNKDDF